MPDRSTNRFHEQVAVCMALVSRVVAWSAIVAFVIVSVLSEHQSPGAWLIRGTILAFIAYGLLSAWTYQDTPQEKAEAKHYEDKQSVLENGRTTRA